MRFARRPRAASPADGRSRLLAQARDGDAVALAALRADLDQPTVARLAALLLPGGDDEADAAGVLAVARGCEDRPDLLEQVVLVLLDEAGRSPALVAELLDLHVTVVLAARERALARSGVAADPPGCRGWVLVGGGDLLTEPEQAAAAAHLARCRRCTAARAASAQAVRRATVPAPRAARPAGT